MDRMARILLLSLVGVSSAISLTAQQTSFRSSEFGFAMLEPKGWFLTDHKVLDASLMQMELSDAMLEKLLRDEADVLLFAYTKYTPNSKRGLNPKIEARVISNGLNRSLTFEEFRPAIERALQTLKGDLPAYTYIQEPTKIDLIGAKGVYQISKFKIRTKERTEYYVRSRTYAIPYKTYFFQISFVDEVGGEDCSTVFDELVKSIKIGK
jgi:hypothetical protein